MLVAHWQMPLGGIWATVKSSDEADAVPVTAAVPLQTVPVSVVCEIVTLPVVEARGAIWVNWPEAPDSARHVPLTSVLDCVNVAVTPSVIVTPEVTN